MVTRTTDAFTFHTSIQELIIIFLLVVTHISASSPVVGGLLWWRHATRHSSPRIAAYFDVLNIYQVLCQPVPIINRVGCAKGIEGGCRRLAVVILSI